MTTLINMITNNVDNAVKNIQKSLTESINMLIGMIKDKSLNTDEMGVIDETINNIVKTPDADNEQLYEKRMSQKAKLAARRYRLKNKAKLAMIAKKKKRCQEKIAGKEDKFACGVDGRPHLIDKKRSRASRMGAKSR